MTFKGKSILIAFMVVLTVSLGVFLSLSLIEKANGGKISPIEKSCANSGGIVGLQNACSQAEEFPNSCERAIGWGGCSLENSAQKKYCECPEGKCFDGEMCVALR